MWNFFTALTLRRGSPYRYRDSPGIARSNSNARHVLNRLESLHKMNDYARLAALSGLSDTALADLHNVRLDTIRHWLTGRRDAPPGVLDELDLWLDCQPGSLPVNK